jgi:acyl-CoA thioesterase-1
MAENDVTILFIGDSVTDCGRRDDADRNLGNGYVRLISEAFEAGGTPANVVNRGINGNRVRDLAARWEKDCLDLAPTLVSVLIGINDTWRRYDDNDPTDVEEFAAQYRALLTALPGREHMALVLVEPFLLVPADAHLNEFDVDPREIAADGVHPTALGHQLLAKLWLDTIEEASA